MDTNYWLRRQARQDEAVPTPDLTEIFREIELDKDWAPSFLAQYLQEPTKSAPPGSVGASDQSSISDLTDPPSGSVSSEGTNHQSGRTTGTAQQKPTQNPLFDPHRAKSLVHKKVKLYCLNNKIALPRCQCVNSPMCISYHLKGMCNSNCGASANYIEHTDEEDQILNKWLKTNYRTE